MKSESMTKSGSNPDDAVKFWTWLTVGMGVFFLYLCIRTPDVINITFSVIFESTMIYSLFKFRKMRDVKKND